jgi:hypothetical protein
MALFRNRKTKNEERYYSWCCFRRFDQRNETIIYLKFDKGYQIYSHMNIKIILWLDLLTSELFKKNRSQNTYLISVIYGEQRNFFFILPWYCNEQVFRLFEIDMLWPCLSERNKIKRSCKKQQNNRKSQSPICSCSHSTQQHANNDHPLLSSSAKVG